jgi:hypothetical protein
MKKSVLLLLFISQLVFTNQSFAQSSGVDATLTFQNVDSKAVYGDILIKSGQGFSLADSPYSIYLFGVLEEKPLLVFRDGNDSSKPITRSGVVNVNVTNINGDIKSGDFITSSPIPGKGQKAERSGYVIGIALEDLKNTNPNITFGNKKVSSGQIPVAMRIEYAEITNPRSSRIADYLNTALFQNIQSPDRFQRLVQYTLSGVVVVTSFLLSFLVFARSAIKGIDAIGRNPLAKRAIQVSIFLNIILALTTTLVGLAAAFVIVRF